MKKTIITALLAATCAISTSAFAEIVEMNGSFGRNLANNNYNATFSFDQPTDNYKVNGLSFSFSFLDNGGTFSVVDTKRTGYSEGNYKHDSYGIWSETLLRQIDISQDVYRTSAQETARLSFGNLVLGNGGTNLVSGTRGAANDPTSSRINDGYRCNFLAYCTYKDTNTTTTTTFVTDDYTGGFTIKGSTTDEALIAQLIGSGELLLNLDIVGKLKLTASKLEVDYSILEVPAEVPEPSSLLLAGVGLAAVGFARRRRSSAAKA